MKPFANRRTIKLLSLPLILSLHLMITTCASIGENTNEASTQLVSTSSANLAQGILSSQEIAKIAQEKPTSPAQLKLSDKDGLTVAHYMAFDGYLFTDPTILSLHNRDGWTVAHEMARKDRTFSDPKILSLATTGGVWGRGWTVAHQVASRGHIIKDTTILRLPSQDGWTVAHIMALKGHVFTDPTIMRLSDKRGWTVADEMNQHLPPGRKVKVPTKSSPKTTAKKKNVIKNNSKAKKN